MPPSRGAAAAAAAFLLPVAAAGAAGGTVTVRVQPAHPLAGELVTVSAQVSSAARRCHGRIARPGAPGAALPARAPRRRAVSWRWSVPVVAAGGAADARVSCPGAGSGRKRFVIRALPPGDPVRGRTTFLLNCGGCHTLADAGTTGTGIDLDARRPGYALAVVRVVNGKGLMPAFKSRLTPQEIADVAAYVAAAAGR